MIYTKEDLKKEIKEKRSPIIRTIVEYAALSVFMGGFSYFWAVNAGASMAIGAACLGFGVPLIVSLPLIMLYYRKEIKEIRNLKRKFKNGNKQVCVLTKANVNVENKEYSPSLDFKNKTIKRFGVTSLGEKDKKDLENAAPEQKNDDFTL